MRDLLSASMSLYGDMQMAMTFFDTSSLHHVCKALLLNKFPHKTSATKAVQYVFQINGPRRSKVKIYHYISIFKVLSLLFFSFEN